MKSLHELHHGGIASVAERLSQTQYELAHSGIEQYKIEMDDFRVLYGDESIERDEAYVRDRQEKFKTKEQEVSADRLTNGEIRRVSECAEYLIIEGINRGWYLDSRAVKTTDYDDIANGIDFIFERQKGHDPATHLGLAVDITCARSMDEKMISIKKAIDTGTLSKIKYFKSGNFKGELSDIPKVIAAVDVFTVERMFKELGQGAEIKTHHMRFIMLQQFELQLEAYEKYAQVVRESLVPSFARALVMLRAAKAEIADEMKKYEHILSEHRTIVSMKEKLAETFSTKPSQTGRILRG
jgi:hypothetical protein